MTYFVVGLGNPGDEYMGTRHNVGREMVEYLRAKGDVPRVKYFVPDQFMNNSGRDVTKFIKSKKAAEGLVVIHDDLDLPLGTFKISFNKGPGGHRGVSSVMKAVKTEAFVRLRVGVSPAGPKGRTKKPVGEDKVIAFILGKFKPAEQKVIAGLRKKIEKALTVLVEEGRDKAMSLVY
jgi:peptidyl-tRNA hydrolase, PTH1 family